MVFYQRVFSGQGGRSFQNHHLICLDFCCQFRKNLVWSKIGDTVRKACVMHLSERGAKRDMENVRIWEETIIKNTGQVGDVRIESLQLGCPLSNNSKGDDTLEILNHLSMRQHMIGWKKCGNDLEAKSMELAFFKKSIVSDISKKNFPFQIYQ